MIPPTSSAAGLLYLLTIISPAAFFSAQGTGVNAMTTDQLRETFQRRSDMQRHVAKLKQRSMWPLRQRSRRASPALPSASGTVDESVVRGGDANQTTVDEKTPPRLVHPSRFECSQGAGRQLAQFDPTNTSFISTFPVISKNEADELVITLGRQGRTGTGSERKRPVNPLIAQELLLGAPADDDIQEFKIYYAFDLPDATEDRNTQNSHTEGSFSNAGGAIQVQPAAKLKAREEGYQRFFEAATKGASGGGSNNNQDGLKAAPTWEGQPSKFRPKTPYQPTLDSGNDYGDIISKGLWFYQVQRSGLLTDGPRPIPWRNDSGLKDGIDNNIDLTGGYYDAGDYLKFTFPLSSALTQLAWAGTEHWRGAVQSHNLGYWDETLRWGFDWIIKAHPAPDMLYVQVGDGNVDNNYWGPDTTIPTPRPSFFVDRDQPGTDVAAGTAGALAAGAIFYATVIGDQQYAQKLLEHALSLYYFAESAKRTLYHMSVPAVKEWYASSDYSDELALAGLLLYRATSNNYFLKRAESYFVRYDVGGNRDPVDWDSKHGLAMLLGAQLVSQNGVKSKVDWVGSLTAYLDETALQQGKTPGGLLYWPGSSDENSLPTSMGITYVLAEYARLFPKQEKAQAFRDLADSQIDYVFGRNPRGIPYVVGVSEKSPKNPQSAMASGGNDIGNVDRSPEKMMRVLYGGMVGGPSKDDSFQDRRSNYKQSECALDYNAPLVALMAGELERGKRPFFKR